MSRWRYMLASLIAGMLVVLGGAATAAPAQEVQAHAPLGTLTMSPDNDDLVVVIGVDNWTWDEVGPQTGPNVMPLLSGARLGSNVPRSPSDLACPVDGWLAVSTGTRLSDPLVDDREDGTRCRTLANEGIDAGAYVDDIEEYVQGAQDQQYAAVPGTLGEWLFESGAMVRGIGPGAGLAMMMKSGQVIGDVLPRPETPQDIYAELLQTPEVTDLLLVDLTGFGIDGPDPDAARATRDAFVDASAAAVTEVAQGRNVSVLVVSLADGASDDGRSLTVVFERRLGPTTATGADFTRTVGFLGSESTRQHNLAQTTDVLPTIIARLGAPTEVPAGLIGLPWTSTPTDLTLPQAIDSLLDDAVQADAQLTSTVVFHVLHRVLLIAMAVIAIGMLAARWRARGRAESSPLSARGSSVIMTTAIAGAVAPAASYLTALLPWWRTPVVLRWVTFTLLLLVITAILTAVTLAVRRWRPGPFTTPVVIAVMTIAVIVWDLLVVAQLSMRSPLGSNVLDAGRFFGLNNTAFALFVVAVVILAVGWVRLCRNNPAAGDRRVLMLGGVIVIGLAAIYVGGAPGIGADLGGIPSTALAIATLLLLVGHWRISWIRALTAGVVAAALALGVAYLDYLRPAEERTHLGRFIEQAMNGQLWTIIERKLSTNAIIAVAITAGLIVVAFVMIVALRVIASRTGQAGWRAVAGQARCEFRLVLRPMPHASWVLAASGVGLVVASVVNDSGLHIALMGGQFLAALMVMWAVESNDLTVETTSYDPGQHQLHDQIHAQ